MLRSTLHVWRAAVALSSESARLVSSSTEKREGRQLSSCFQSWRQRLAEGNAFRLQLRQMGQAHDTRLQGHVLASWRDHKTMCRQHQVCLASTAESTATT